MEDKNVNIIIEKDKKSKKPLILAILCVLIIAIGTILCVLVLNKKDNTDKKKPKEKISNKVDGVTFDNILDLSDVDVSKEFEYSFPISLLSMEEFGLTNNWVKLQSELFNASIIPEYRMRSKTFEYKEENFTDKQTFNKTINRMYYAYIGGEYGTNVFALVFDDEIVYTSYVSKTGDKASITYKIDSSKIDELAMVDSYLDDAIAGYHLIYKSDDKYFYVEDNKEFINNEKYTSYNYAAVKSNRKVLDDDGKETGLIVKILIFDPEDSSLQCFIDSKDYLYQIDRNSDEGIYVKANDKKIKRIYYNNTVNIDDNKISFNESKGDNFYTVKVEFEDGTFEDLDSSSYIIK